jgi:Tfp pilus assembly protein PilF
MQSILTKARELLDRDEFTAAIELLQRDDVDPRLAAEEIEAVLKRVPENYKLLLACARYYAWVGHIETAVALYVRTSEYCCPRLFYTKSVAALKEALAIAPDSVDLHVRLGDSYSRIGLTKDAISAYSFAIDPLEKHGELLRLHRVLEALADVDYDNEAAWKERAAAVRRRMVVP